MGYDYRGSSSSPVGSVAPIGGPRYDIGDTVRAYVGPHPGLEGHPRRAVLRPGLVDRRPRRSTRRTSRAPSTGRRRRSSTRPPANTPRTTASSCDPVEGVAWTAYRRENCTAAYGCVKPWRQIYYDDAKALGPSTTWSTGTNLRGAGIWALGYDGTRTELYAGAQGQVHHRQGPAGHHGVVAQRAVRVAERRRAAGHRHGPADRHRPHLVRLGRRAVLRRLPGRPSGAGSVVGKTAAFTWDGRTPPARSSGRTVPDHHLDSRRLEQQVIDSKVVTVDRHAAGVTLGANPG